MDREWICIKSLLVRYNQQDSFVEKLSKFGYREEFINMLQCFRDGVKAWVNVGGKPFEQTKIKNGVK